MISFIRRVLLPCVAATVVISKLVSSTAWSADAGPVGAAIVDELAPTMHSAVASAVPSLIRVSHDSSASKFETGHVGSALRSSTVISLRDQAYYIDGEKKYDLKLSLAPGFHASTVISLHGGATSEAINSTIHRFEQSDDVFCIGFLGLVIFVLSPDESQDLSTDAMSLLHSFGTKYIGFLERHGSVELPNEGPYFAMNQGLFQVWKLYPDTYGAFVRATTHESRTPDKYTHLNASTPDSPANLAVAVPSRLYFQKTKEKPLNGLRVAVKDNIDLHGVKTCGMSRSYFQLYPPASKSAFAVQRLIDLGAVVVGKTGMSQFADAEDPTGDYVDFHCPFNPRGDGARSPGGSSSGSGSAAAAYEWLDFSIGTDTGGSVRVPAAFQGVFGIRPSHGKMSIEGTMVIHRDLDTIGILSKDLRVLQKVSQEFYLEPGTETTDASQSNLQHIKRLLYPVNFFPVTDAPAQSLYNDIVSKLEKVLGVEREEVDFEHVWRKYRSSEIDESLDSYFHFLLYDYVVWGSYHERAQFREDYKDKFGRNAYVNPLTQFRWQLGAEMTSEHFSAIQSKRALFQKFIEHVYGNNSIMVTPFMHGEPEARDIYRSQPSDRDLAELAMGLRPAFYSVYAGQPEIVFPIGQLPVESSISGNEEFYAVIGSIIGPKGMDQTVVNIVEALLEEAEIPLKVKTGPAPYTTEESSSFNLQRLSRTKEKDQSPIIAGNEGLHPT